MKHPVTTRERLQARFGKFSSWVNQVDGEISALNHREKISGVDGAIFLISQVQNSSGPIIDEAKMAKLKERLKMAGVRNALPTADPRLMDIKAPEQIAVAETATDEADVDDKDAEEKVKKASATIERIRRQMLVSFQDELQDLWRILPAVKAKALAAMKSLVRERRELSGIRKSLGNLLRDRHAGAKAAFELMAKGGPDPSWVWHGNVK